MQTRIDSQVPKPHVDLIFCHFHLTSPHMHFHIRWSTPTRSFTIKVIHRQRRKSPSSDLNFLSPLLINMTPTTIYSLPGEVRNQIWRELVLSAEGTIQVEPLCEPDKQKLHQPTIAFTCKQFRDEALSIYYAENTWHLGKIGYHDPTHIRLYHFKIRLARWQAMLGPYTKYLARLSMGVDGRCYAWEDWGVPADAKYELRVLREGAVHFERNGKLRCTCRLKPGVEMMASRDGGVLLQVMKEYSESYCEPVHEGKCDGCGKTRLEKFGRSEVKHQPLWEDIVIT